MALAVMAALPAHACWEDAASRYRVNAHLLYAIARTESAVNPAAIGRNRNGSRDIGLMQINSTWLETLARHGINEADLFDPCININVGAGPQERQYHNPLQCYGDWGIDRGRESDRCIAIDADPDNATGSKRSGLGQVRCHGRSVAKRCKALQEEN